MYRTFADVVTKNDLDEQAKQAGERPLTPPIEGGKPFNDVVERSPAQAAYMDKIIQRMENLPKDPRIDNPLKVTNDARKAGLDFRLIAPTADEFEGSMRLSRGYTTSGAIQPMTRERSLFSVICPHPREGRLRHPLRANGRIWNPERLSTWTARLSEKRRNRKT